MSCPYLEKGNIPRCRANGNLRLRVWAGEGEADCFSGDFSDCPFLVSPRSLGARRTLGGGDFSTGVRPMASGERP